MYDLRHVIARCDLHKDAFVRSPPSAPHTQPTLHLHPPTCVLYLSYHAKQQIDSLVMTQTTAAESEETQNGYEDAGVGGPGAPTPLSALEVRYKDRLLSKEYI